MKLLEKGVDSKEYQIEQKDEEPGIHADIHIPDDKCLKQNIPMDHIAECEYPLKTYKTERAQCQ